MGKEKLPGLLGTASLPFIYPMLNKENRVDKGENYRNGINLHQFEE
jgi:hypothetical protein